MKNYVAMDVPLQNVLFGRTQFTPEGDPVDVDLFDVYCPQGCLAVDDLVNDVKVAEFFPVASASLCVVS